MATNYKETSHHKPPSDIDAEKALLGSILKDEKALVEVIDYIKSEEYFYSPKHRHIYRAVINLHEKNEPVDITTAADELNKLDMLDKIGGRLYLVELVEIIATTANAGAYAKIVVEKALLRSLIDTSNKILTNCFNSKEEVEELLDSAESEIFTITEKRVRTDFTQLSDLIPSTFDEIEEFQESKGGLTGIPTGFDKLDSMTAGMHGGDLIVIAGRPSMGKTAFALNVAEYAAIEHEKSVGIFSIEMSKEQLALRMLCGRAKISQHMLRTQRLKDAEWQRLSMVADPLSNAKIYIDDSPTLTTLEVRAKARRLKAKHDVDMIVVDYIQMMDSTGRVENRQQEMAKISRALKSLAKELNIAVIAISQLSRMVEMRGGEKRPQLADLRESGAIEQDADAVMFVYRPEFYLSHLDKDDPKLLEVEGRAELIIAKQRNGPTGKVDLAFVKEFARFENLAQFAPPPVYDEESPF